MIEKYGFMEQYAKNSFQDNCNTGIIYFPVDDSESFPCVIRDKAEELIDDLIFTYENENGNPLDLSKLRLNARIEVYLSCQNIPVSNISVIIANDYGDDELWMNKDAEIKHGDILYKPFKEYFMKQLEKSLFEENMFFGLNE